MSKKIKCIRCRRSDNYFCNSLFCLTENDADKKKVKIPATIGEVDGRESSSSDTEVDEPKKRARSGSLKKDQGSNSRRGSKQLKEMVKNYSTTSGDDPDLESDAKTPKRLRNKKKHKDSDFFASSDSDFKEKQGNVDLKPVEEEIQVNGFASS